MSRMAVIGGLNLDEVVYLDGPLLPGGRMRARGREHRVGGGGANTAVALALAGHAVRLWGAVGDDDAGRRILAELAGHGIDASGVARRAGPTPCPLILVDEAAERTIIKVEQPLSIRLDPPVAADLAGVAGMWINAFTPALAAPMAAAVAARKTLVCAHLPPPPIDRWPAHVMVASGLDPRDVLARAQALAGEALRWVVVTEGARGAVALHVGGDRVSVPAAPARAVDTTGAGDAFTAGLLHGLTARRLPMDRALSLACRFGAAAVEHAASLPPERLRSLAAADVGA
ncbi:PfkB family carbohydrate kinase [Caenispirillum salinarum]|uniref:PfkB family carbohydrate kinase n=1 Tax=Caenispirillum salinarum TaxID=859058 RepID=UPI0038512EDE